MDAIGENIEVQLSAENLILRGSSVRGTKFIQGIVVYAGKDTRIMMNNQKSEYKFSRLDKETYRSILFIFLIQVITCLVIAFLGDAWLLENTLIGTDRSRGIRAIYLE